MKALFISLTLLIFAQTAFAQYSPLAVEGKYWINMRHIVQEAPQPISAFAVVIGSDTIVDGQLYHRVYQQELAGTYWPSEGGFIITQPYQAESTELIAFLRDDVDNQKVYNRPVTSSSYFCEPQEHLLFDFSLEQGDVLNPCAYAGTGASVDDPEWGLVDSIGIQDGKKILYTTGIASTLGLAAIDEIRIIEGRGFSNFNLYHPYGNITLEAYCPGGDAICQTITNTSAIQQNSRISIFPNPSEGYYNIKLPDNHTIRNIAIYDAKGRRIAVSTNTQNALDLTTQANGIYAVVLTLDNGKQYVERVVKM